MRRTRKSRKRRGNGRGGAKAPALAERVEEKLSKGGLHTIWCEEYGPDGEIVKAEEWAPTPTRTIDFYIVTEHGFAEPRRDWRERGVVPPEGVHPWAGRGSGVGDGRRASRESRVTATAGPVDAG